MFNNFLKFVLAASTLLSCPVFAADQYKLLCAHRQLSASYDTLSTKWYSPEVCRDLYDKTSSVSLISEAIKRKYPSSEYGLSFFVDEVDGNREVISALFIKRISDGDNTKAFAISYESADGEWDQRTRALNSLIALGYAVEAMNKECVGSCDLFSSNGIFLKKKIRSNGGKQ